MSREIWTHFSPHLNTQQATDVPGNSGSTEQLGKQLDRTLIVKLLKTTRRPFEDSKDHDQTAEKVQSDL